MFSPDLEAGGFGIKRDNKGVGSVLGILLFYAVAYDR